MKKTLALILALVLTFAFFGCGKTETTAPSATPAPNNEPSGAPVNAPVKDTLVIAIETEGNDFDPQNSGQNISSAGVVRAVYENLVRNDKDGVPYGVLATDWEWLDDGMAIKFYLRKGVTFSNGEPFTADDLVFSYKERFPTSANGKSEATFDFQNMQVVNDYEVIIPLKKNASDALNTLTHMKYGVMNREAVAQYGDRAGTNPVGTGAYVLDELIQGDRMVLKANPNYWGKQPALKTITIRIIKENSQAQVELESGNVDACVFYNGNNDVLRVMNGEIPGLQTIRLFNAVNSLRLNFKKDFAKNKLIRQALNYALDRVAIAKADSNGLNTPAYQPGIPGYACYIEEFNTKPPYEYNPQKAIELLKEAGVYNNLTLECYTDVSTAAVTDAQLVKNMFAAVGVTLNIHSLEAGTVVPIVIAGEENDCFLGFGISDWTGSLLQRFRSACDPNYSPDFEHRTESEGYMKIYEKFLEAEKTLDRDEAIRLMRECAIEEMEEALNIPLTATNIFINCIEGLHVEWYFGDCNFQNWYFE